MKLKAWIALTLILSGACSFRPKYQRPKSPISDKFRGQGEEQSLSSLNWNEYFKDPQLKELIELTLKNNRDLKISSQKIAQARAIYGIQKASQLPTIGASVSGGLIKSTATNSLSSGTGSRTIDGETFQASLGISSWELDFWGRLESLKEAALESYLASLEGRRATLLALISQLSQSYLLQAELVQRIKLAESTLAIRQEGNRIANKRFDVGSGTKIESAQTLILLNQAKFELATLNRYKEQNLNALTLLVGSALPYENFAPLTDIEKYYQFDIPSGLPSDLLNRRPDILSAEHLLKSANANIGAARAAYFPSISLTAAYNQASVDLGGLVQGHGNSWNFSPKLDIPIFTGGRLDSNMKLAKAKKLEAIYSYERAIQNAFREVSDALAERRWTREQLTIQQETLEAQEARAEISKKRYDKGSASYLEVLDSERDKFTVEQGLVQIKRAYLATTISLFAALGGEPSINTTDSEDKKNE